MSHTPILWATLAIGGAGLLVACSGSGDTARLTDGHRRAPTSTSDGTSPEKTLDSAPLEGGGESAAPVAADTPPATPAKPSPAQSAECKACEARCDEDAKTCAAGLGGKEVDPDEDRCMIKFNECVSKCLATPACTGVPEEDDDKDDERDDDANK